MAGTLVATKYEDIRSGEITWGFRVYDEYETFYCNTLEESEAKTEDDIEFLKIAMQYYIENSDGGSFFDSIAEMKLGLNINDEYYDWEEISEAF